LAAPIGHKARLKESAMPNHACPLLRAAALAASLALAACSGAGEGNNLASLDSQLEGNDVDPALTSALADQISVDPTLANQSNRNAVRPPETPTQAPYPATQAGGATGRAPAPARAGGETDGQHEQLAGAARGEGGAACGSRVPFNYDLSWAGRLSPVFPVYPGAKVTEAAGNDQGDCRVRVVTFTAAAGFQHLLDWYHTRAVRAGYSSEHQIRGGDHILAGTNESDGGAFYLIVTPAGNGSQVALIANKGR
jgi:hypothetical protein